MRYVAAIHRVRSFAHALALAGLLCLAGTLPAAEPQPYTQTIPGTDIKFDMLPIPGGKFMLGSPASEKGRKAEEGPQVEVTIEPFYMGKHEVTWSEFWLFMQEYDRLKSAKDLPAIPKEREADVVSFPTPLYEPSHTYEKGKDPRHPAVNMTQLTARMYCKWLSKKTGEFYRLPTEAEWEYACRAGTTTAYWFGDDASKLGDHEVYFDNSDDHYATVGSKKPNPWGLYDMHGNVSEWVLDQWSDKHYASLKGPVSWKDAVLWPTKADKRAARGGNWDAEAPLCRSAARMASDEKEWKIQDPQIPRSLWWYTDNPWVGFRLVKPVNPPSIEEQNKHWNPDLSDLQERLLTETKQVRVLIEKAK